MVVKCDACAVYYDDEYRLTTCPHAAFAANDGHNNFAVHNDAYLSEAPPSGDQTQYDEVGEARR